MVMGNCYASVSVIEGLSNSLSNGEGNEIGTI